MGYPEKMLDSKKRRAQSDSTPDLQSSDYAVSTQEIGEYTGLHEDARLSRCGMYALLGLGR